MSIPRLSFFVRAECLLASYAPSTQQETMDSSDPDALKHIALKGIALMEEENFSST